MSGFASYGTVVCVTEEAVEAWQASPMGRVNALLNGQKDVPEKLLRQLSKTAQQVFYKDSGYVGVTRGNEMVFVPSIRVSSLG